MPSANIPFSAETIVFLATVAKKEYPKGDKRLISHGKKITPLSKLIQQGAIKEGLTLAPKHNVKIPDELQGELKA